MLRHSLTKGIVDARNVQGCRNKLRNCIEGLFISRHIETTYVSGSPLPPHGQRLAEYAISLYTTYALFLLPGTSAFGIFKTVYEQDGLQLWLSIDVLLLPGTKIKAYDISFCC